MTEFATLPGSRYLRNYGLERPIREMHPDLLRLTRRELAAVLLGEGPVAGGVGERLVRAAGTPTPSYPL